MTTSPAKSQAQCYACLQRGAALSVCSSLWGSSGQCSSISKAVQLTWQAKLQAGTPPIAQTITAATFLNNAPDLQCKAGEFRQMTPYSCAPCPVKTYRNLPGGFGMADCVAPDVDFKLVGFVGSRNTGATGETECVAGEVPSPDLLSCKTCTPRDAEKVKGTCGDCGFGYASVAMESMCKACSAGTEVKDAVTSNGKWVSGLDECVACGVGKYSDGAANEDCKSPDVDCVASADHIAQVKCDPAGKVPSTDKSACEACTAGTAETSVGQCEPCPAGSYCPAGSAIPTPCASGTYSTTTSATDASTCQPCPAGNYCSDPAADPTPCPTGQVAAAESANCASCQTNQFPNIDKSACITPEVGFQVCSGATNAALVLGQDLQSSKVCKVSANAAPSIDVDNMSKAANDVAQAALALSQNAKCAQDKICLSLQADAAAMAAGTTFLVGGSAASFNTSISAATSAAMALNRYNQDFQAGSIWVGVGGIFTSNHITVVGVIGDANIGSVVVPAVGYRYAARQLASTAESTRTAALAGIIATRALELSAFAQKYVSATPALAASYAAAAAAQLKALGVDTTALQTSIEALAALAPQTGVALSDCQSISTDGSTINFSIGSCSVSQLTATNGRFSLPSGPFDIVQDSGSLKLVYRQDSTTSDSFSASCASLMGAGATSIAPPLYLADMGDGNQACLLLNAV